MTHTISNLMSKKIWLILLIATNYTGADLIKIDKYGQTLPTSATIWSCVLDNQTGLMWEVKTTNKNMRNKNNTYTWYHNKTGTRNGKYSHNCSWYDFCNTSLYTELSNDFKLCGYQNWRLPINQELKNLYVFGEEDPIINTDFFPNTQANNYWSATLDNDDKNLVLDVPFFYGGSSGSEKQFDAYIRLVRQTKLIPITSTNTLTIPISLTLNHQSGSTTAQ